MIIMCCVFHVLKSADVIKDVNEKNVILVSLVDDLLELLICCISA